MPPELAATCNVVYFPQLGYFVAVTREYEQMFEYNLGLPPDFRLQVSIFVLCSYTRISQALFSRRSSQPMPMPTSRTIAPMVRNARKYGKDQVFNGRQILELDESLGDNHGMIIGKQLLHF